MDKNLFYSLKFVEKFCEGIQKTVKQSSSGCFSQLVLNKQNVLCERSSTDAHEPPVNSKSTVAERQMTVKLVSGADCWISSDTVHANIANMSGFIYKISELIFKIMGLAFIKGYLYLK